LRPKGGGHTIVVKNGHLNSKNSGRNHFPPKALNAKGEFPSNKVCQIKVKEELWGIPILGEEFKRLGTWSRRFSGRITV